MTTSGEHKQQPRRGLRAGGLGLYVAVALAAGLFGFAAIYVTAPRSANEVAGVAQDRPASASVTADAGSTAQRADPTGSQPSLPTRPGANPLSVGDMAMFVFRDPVDLDPVTFNGEDGQELDFSAWRGRVVLVNLWATWCAPCRHEMPDLDRLQKTLGSADFEVVAISVDRGTPDKPRAFLEEIGATSLKLYHDPSSRIGARLKVIGLPATLLLDRNGREVGRLIGPAKWDSPDAIRLIEAAVSSTRQSP
ncbi:MAG: TlpA disulfide reductase family protein [Hyphomicrobiaceae bacterium]